MFFFISYNKTYIYLFQKAADQGCLKQDYLKDYEYIKDLYINS